MKRIVLGISVLLMLVQNGFALSEKEMDSLIQKANNMKLVGLANMFKCQKASKYAKSASDAKICLKAIKSIKSGDKMGEYGKNKYEDITSCYFNAGVISANNGDDLNAYKYWVKTAKRAGDNGIQAQKFIKRICARSSWVCK